MPMRELILGGARSGKSHHAQTRALALAMAKRAPVLCVVTAQARDAEMAARIAQHQADRPPAWQVVEAVYDLPEAIAGAPAEAIVLVDCLSLWLSNLLCDAPATLPARSAALIAAVQARRGDLLMVSNEVGWGVVPDNPLARSFRDEAGRLHQGLGQVCERVTLVVAGFPTSLKNAVPA